MVLSESQQQPSQQHKTTATAETLTNKLTINGVYILGKKVTIEPYTMKPKYIQTYGINSHFAWYVYIIEKV